jgi:hypothetical protein
MDRPTDYPRPLPDEREDCFDLGYQEARKQFADEIKSKLEPRLEEDQYTGGYNCCGCSTYRQIMEDAIAIALGTYEAPTLDADGYTID